MKKFIVALALLSLSLLMVLTGCKTGTGGNTETEPPAKKADPITVFANGSSAYTIVYAENAAKTLVDASVSLRSAFMKIGAELPLCDEYMYGISNGTVAVVVGETSDEVTIRLKQSLQYDDFVIHAENGNLYLIGGSNGATVEAVNYFIDTYLAERQDTLVLEGDLSLKYTHEYKLKNLTINGTPVSSYKIVYDNTLYYAKARAQDLRDLIVKSTGVMLEVTADTAAAESAHEILIGVTNRAESRQIASTFSRPNVYYKVSVSGSKLVMVNQGVRTGEAAFKEIEKLMEQLTPEACDITASNLNVGGDILSQVDSSDALERPDGTDVRLMHSNVLVATFPPDNDNGYTDQQRAELLVDTYLIYMPDVITYNEMIFGRNMTSAIRSLLSEYYVFTDGAYMGLFPDPANMDNNLTNRKYATPIAYSKASGLKEIDSGFNYLSDMISYHGVAWTVFETVSGNRFMAVSAHFSENKNENGAWITTFSADTMKVINTVRSEYGDLPVVANGDWFFWQNSAPYKYMIDSGFVDASETALKKHSVSIGTYHTVGIGETTRVEEDICFINPEWFTALAHKILVDFYTVNGSDHYPVIVDLKLKKSATVDDILPFDDGSGVLNVKEEGAGGSGNWGTDTVTGA